MDPRMARSWPPGWPDHGSNMAFHGFSPPDVLVLSRRVVIHVGPEFGQAHPPRRPDLAGDARLGGHVPLLSRLDPSLAGLQEEFVAVARRRDAYRRRRPPRPRDPGEEDFTGEARRGLPALPAPGVHLQERDGDHGGGAFLPRPARALRRRARSAERGGEARSWGSDASKSWRRRRGGGRPALLPPSRSESDFRQIRVGLPNRARVGFSIVRRPFPRSGPGAGGQADPRCGSGWGSPFEVAKKPLRGHFRGQCRDSCGGSAGAVAGAAPGLLRGQRRGCCGGCCGGQDSGWRWLSRPRSRPSRPATSPGKNRRFWFGGAPLASGNRVLPEART